MKNHKAILIFIFGLLAGIAVMLVQQRRAADLAAYATAHNCEWSYQGTIYGDDRDYICK